MKLDRVIAQLRELNEPVPKPARLPTADDIEAVQRQLRVPIHDDMIQYLLEASDVTYGTFEPVTITDPHAHTHLPTVAAEAWKIGIPRDDYLPICADNGDYYCINPRGEIVFINHDGDLRPSEKWPDLATWIEVVWIGESQDDDDEDEEEDEDEE